MLTPDLEALLSPLGLERFGRKYWRRRPYHDDGSGRGLEEMERAWGGLAPSVLLGLRLDAIVVSRTAGGSNATEVTRDPDYALDRLREGASLLFDLDVLRSEIRPWYDAYTAPLAPRPNRSGGNVICSAPGQGTPLHVDDHDVLHLHLSGRKTWWVGMEEGDNLRTLELGRGSLLYLPAGTPHATLASEEPSVGLSFVLGRETLEAEVPAEILEVSPATALRRSPLARRAEGETIIVTGGGRDLSAVLEPEARPLLDWVDARPADFRAREAPAEIRAALGAPEICAIFEVLLAAGYLREASGLS